MEFNRAKHHLVVPYKSGWFTVVIPTLITLGVGTAIFFSTLVLMNWNISSWLGILLFFVGFIPCIIKAWKSYSFFYV